MNALPSAGLLLHHRENGGDFSGPKSAATPGSQPARSWSQFLSRAGQRPARAGPRPISSPNRCGGSCCPRKQAKARISFFRYEFSVDPPRSAKTWTASRPPSPIGSRRISSPNFIAPFRTRCLSHARRGHPQRDRKAKPSLMLACPRLSLDRYSCDKTPADYRKDVGRDVDPGRGGKTSSTRPGPRLCDRHGAS